MAFSEKAMVEPPEEEASASASASASAAEEACFADELVLLDFDDELYDLPIGAASSSYSSTAAVAGELERQSFFQDLFEPSDDGLPGLPAEVAGGGDKEVEELEWLVNKDAFPGLETSFEIPAHSRSSNGGSAAVGLAGERPNSASFLAAAAASLSVPVRRRSKGRRRRRTVLTDLSPEHAVMAVARVAATPANRRRCRHCEAEETPQWRAGPEGPKTLCNACGVRYKSGRLVPEYRPASSPTFSTGIHSNSHRRILEMRRQKTTGERRGTGAPPPLGTLITPPVV